MKPYFFIMILITVLSGCTESQRPVCPHSCLFDEYNLNLSVATLSDAYKGSMIGQRLPSKDKLVAAYNAQHALKDQQLHIPYVWKNLDQSSEGIFELLSFSAENFTTCFRYKQIIQINEILLSAHGKACQDSFKIWRIIEEIPDKESEKLFLITPPKKESPCCFGTQERT